LSKKNLKIATKKHILKTSTFLRNHKIFICLENCSIGIFYQKLWSFEIEVFELWFDVFIFLFFSFFISHLISRRGMVLVEHWIVERWGLKVFWIIRSEWMNDEIGACSNLWEYKRWNIVGWFFSIFSKFKFHHLTTVSYKNHC
jgi:hypothetical protein